MNRIAFEIDITELFKDAICSNIDGISVISFNDPSASVRTLYAK